MLARCAMPALLASTLAGCYVGVRGGPALNGGRDLVLEAGITGHLGVDGRRSSLGDPLGRRLHLHGGYARVSATQVAGPRSEAVTQGLVGDLGVTLYGRPRVEPRGQAGASSGWYAVGTLHLGAGRGEIFGSGADDDERARLSFQGLSLGLGGHVGDGAIGVVAGAGPTLSVVTFDDGHDETRVSFTAYVRVQGGFILGWMGELSDAARAR